VDYAEHTRKEFERGFNCAQIVLSVFAARLGMDEALARRLAAGFGGGVARMGGTCGAVSGAYMALGLKYGSASAGDHESKETVYRLEREFRNRFEAKHGSTTCRDLLGLDLGREDQYQEAKDRKLFQTVCANFVAEAVGILEELMKTNP